MAHVARFSVSMEPDLLAGLDGYCGEKGYPNRSEAVRDLVREALAARRLESGGVMVGAVTILYDHHHPGLVERLLALQHDGGVDILANTHLHLDHHNCLEVIIARGAAADVRRMADRIIALKGVAQGDVVAIAPP